MSLTVLIAPSGFKECMDAQEVADAMALGVARAWPDATILKAPIADGGEGFTRSLCEATGGEQHKAVVTGPLGEPIPATVGLLGGCDERTAVLEIAAACGLSLVPPARRNPLLTTSFGVGELIRKALDLGARRILIGCGDSGVNDGGAGLLQALGAKLLTVDGNDIGRGAAGLLQLDRIDLSGLDPRLASVRIDVTVNWHNALLGPRGVSRVYGPQKGATPELVPVLERALEIFAARVTAATGIDVGAMPGSGASGGIGAGLAGCLGAKLHPRYDVVFKHLDLDGLLRRADLVLTAEGALDGQTPFGKVPAEIGRRAASHGIPVIALAGTVGAGARSNLSHGISAFGSIQVAPTSLSDAMINAAELLADASEQAIRAVGAGLAISANHRRQTLGRGTRRSSRVSKAMESGTASSQAYYRVRQSRLSQLSV
jgi:glycerate kinase